MFLLALISATLTSCSFMSMVAKKCTTTGKADVNTGSFEACIKCDSLRPNQVKLLNTYSNGR